jgi:hypothetical protein
MERRMIMRIALLSFVLLIVAATAATAEPLTFGTVTLSTGSTWTQSGRYGSSIRLSVDNGMGTGHSYSASVPPAEALQEKSVAVVKTVTVRAMAGPKISAADVEYSSVRINNVDVTSKFSGKTYVLTINGSRVNAVSYPGGAEPPADEVAFVRGDNVNIGQMREMDRTFGGKSVNIGDTLRAQDPEDLFDVQAGFSVDFFSMRLARVDGEAADAVATFDLSLNVSSSIRKGKNAAASDPEPFADSRVTLRLDGVLRANVATGRILEIDLSGPASASGSRDAEAEGVKGKGGRGGASTRRMSASGTGTGFMKSTYSYQ